MPLNKETNQSITIVTIHIFIAILLRTPTYGRAKAGRPARTFADVLIEYKSFLNRSI